MALSLIFWACFFLVAYTYLLYPAVLFLASSLARLGRRAGPAPEAGPLPAVTMIIPAHNEERLRALQAELAAFGLRPVLLGTSDPFDVDRAFLEWAEERRRTRFASRSTAPPPVAKTPSGSCISSSIAACSTSRNADSPSRAKKSRIEQPTCCSIT